jgi:hypothetical protein
MTLHCNFPWVYLLGYQPSVANHSGELEYFERMPIHHVLVFISYEHKLELWLYKEFYEVYTSVGWFLGSRRN